VRGVTAITLLKLEPLQSVPRPFNRVSSVAEAVEILDYWRKRQPPSAIKKQLAACTIQANLDTEKTVFEYGGVKFYAFTESQS
jgi:hypothetical protein